MSEKALVTQIQRYSIHDGPGIRTVVFFKGCPLRCRWCCNPETQNASPELSLSVQRCIGKTACGYCADVCPAGAAFFSQDGAPQIDRMKCTCCFRCVSSCPAGARRVEGEQKTADEILDWVEKDAPFYNHGNGGLTLSGGEPLSQGDFLIHLLKKAKQRRLNVAMETCGYGEYALLREVAGYLDVLLFDIKSLDREKHIACTGKSNDLILHNFERLCADFPGLDKWVRTPVIPGFNDAPEDVRDILAFLHHRPNVRFKALPYHRFGEEKYRALGRPYEINR
jgi:pyruvate formate lyase activating enzyme